MLTVLSLVLANGQSEMTRWVEFYKIPSEVVKMDADSIRKEEEDGKELVYVWFKYHKINVGVEARAHEIYLVTFDCSGRKFAVRTIARISYSGEVIEENNRLDAGLMPVLPDSRVESHMQFACEWVYLDEERRNQSKRRTP